MIFYIFVFTIIGTQFVVIITLCSNKLVYKYAKGEDFNMFQMDGKVYDVLKWVAMLFLPALAVLVKTIFAVWQIPYGEEISTSIMAIDAFLGAILGISHIQYTKGDKDADN